MGSAAGADDRDEATRRPAIELQYDFAAYTVTLSGLPKRERVVTVGTTLTKERTRLGPA